MARARFVAAGAVGIAIVAIVAWNLVPHKTRAAVGIPATIVPNGDGTCKITLPDGAADDKNYPYWGLLSNGNGDYLVWQSQAGDINTYNISFPDDTPFSSSQFTVSPGSMIKSGAPVDAGLLCGFFGHVCKYNYTIDRCSNSKVSNNKSNGGVQATPILTMGVHISR